MKITKKEFKMVVEWVHISDQRDTEMAALVENNAAHGVESAWDYDGGGPVEVTIKLWQDVSESNVMPTCPPGARAADLDPWTSRVLDNLHKKYK